MRLIDADKLCEYANNLADKSVDANDIMRFPRVDAESVRHGRWIVDDGCSYCSVCRNNFKKAIMTKAKYCPMCGAKMDGGEDGKTD